jgi:hypothetical protein
MTRRLFAAERHRRNLAQDRQQSELEEFQRRERVIAEFAGDLNAMAAAILRYRHAVVQLFDAVDWMRQGAPFIALGPGPHWKPAAADRGVDKREADAR